MAATDENNVDTMRQFYENLILIDVGANLTNKKYSRDLDAVIQRAQDSGQLNLFLLLLAFLLPIQTMKVVSIEEKSYQFRNSITIIEKQWKFW